MGTGSQGRTVVVNRQQKGWADALLVYGQPRVLLVSLFGFSSGLPFLLTGGTLNAWMAQTGISLTAIGFFGLVSIAYSLKFLWAPVVDRVPLPLLTVWLGRRRAWMLISQLLIVGGILAMSRTDPVTEVWWLVFWAVFVAFASATQDIALDAYRTEILETSQLGAGIAIWVAAYRIATIMAGAGAFIIADHQGFSVAYTAMAGLMCIGILTTLFAPEPEKTITRESVALETAAKNFLDNHGHLPFLIRRIASQIYGAVICPFAEFMTRPHWPIILLFVALYKYGDVLVGAMANPFYINIGFSLTEIGQVTKLFGVIMTIIGGFLGGAFVVRVGILRALLIGGILQALSNIMFIIQAKVGYSLPMLAVTIGVENITSGLATAAFVAYLSSLCNFAYTATQFALLSSLMAIGRTVLGSFSGLIADTVGDWATYFAITTGAALPGLFLLLWLIKRYPPPKRLSAGAVLADD